MNDFQEDFEFDYDMDERQANDQVMNKFFKNTDNDREWKKQYREIMLHQDERQDRNSNNSLSNSEDIF